jgi:hypothetical protein
MIENKRLKNVMFGIFVFIASISISFGQTNATDFDATDCDGNAHNLFSELDSGKIIVIAWVMPCGPCGTFSLPAYASVLSYSVNHPGKVLFYMADDYGNSSCQDLNAFATTYQMTESTIFIDPVIKMTDYGSNGMPKVVVLGGSEHKVYYNEKEGDITTQGVDAAIDEALGLSNRISENSNIQFQLNAFPNPANNLLNVSYELGQASELIFEVLNISGSNVMRTKNEGYKGTGIQTSEIDINGLSRGAYFLKATADFGLETIMFTVSQ